MILDSQEVFSAAQTVTATGDTASTNQLDTLSSSDDGMGEDITVIAMVNTTFTSGGGATMQAVLQTSVDNATWTDALAGKVFPVAQLTKGTQLLNTIYPIGMARYVRVVYRTAVAVMTAGAMDAFNVKNPQAYQFGATGFFVA